jgi:hypothetical protein
MICAAFITFGKFHTRCGHSGAVHQLVFGDGISAAQEQSGKKGAQTKLSKVE